MGMFDSIYFKCPSCGAELEAQSKSGNCTCASYNPDKVPIEVAQDANRHAPYECECGKKWIFDTSVLKKLPQEISLPIKEYAGEDLDTI